MKLLEYNEPIVCAACKAQLDDLAGDYVVLGRHAMESEVVNEVCPACSAPIRLTHHLSLRKVQVETGPFI